MIARFLLAAAILLPSLALAELSPYAGQQSRPIKALSQEDIDGLLAGKGMQMAKPAELNSYPGPRHAREMAAELDLTAEQSGALERLEAQMAADAQRLGAELVEAERALDRLFAERTADAAAIDDLTRKIGVLQGRLRAVHLKTHLETTAILTAHQVRRYDVLRGYTGTPSPEAHGGHTGHRGH